MISHSSATEAVVDQRQKDVVGTWHWECTTRSTLRVPMCAGEDITQMLLAEASQGGNFRRRRALADPIDFTSTIPEAVSCRTCRTLFSLHWLGMLLSVSVTSVSVPQLKPPDSHDVG